MDAVAEFEDEVFGPPSLAKTVVIGCGNLLRGDDAVGPILIRYLWEHGWTDGVPDDVVLVDGGTAGMDVAFKMESASSVILIDAAITGVAPGTIYCVPASELVDLPPLQGLHSHQFRWDHSLSFARWLLKDRCPTDISVFLIEIESCVPGAGSTPNVESAMKSVAKRVMQMCILSEVREVDTSMTSVEVELTADGYPRINATIAQAFSRRTPSWRRFANMSCGFIR